MESRYYIPLDQVQGNVTPGFRKDFEDFLFVQFPAEALDDPKSPAASRVRSWLNDLLPCITSAREVATFNGLYRLIRRRTKQHPSNAPASRFIRSTWVNVVFTALGHAALLGEDPWPADSQPGAYRAGLYNRSNHTGDVMRSLTASDVRDSVSQDVATGGKPNNVDDASQQQQVAHALIIIGADSADALDIELARQLELIATHGLTQVARFRGATLGGGREHFGFRDGLSQPDPDDILDGWLTNEQKVAPGEFVRGCEEEQGHTYPPPLAWERFGSYLVFRRLRQNVSLFHSESAKAARQLSCPVTGDAAALTPALFEAMCVGRHQDGTPLNRPLPDPNAAESDDNLKRFRIRAQDFIDDPEGITTPHFAHIRKVHPRDQDSEHPRHHRLIRRGIPYGPVLQSYAPGLTPVHADRGLLFVAYMASIEGQFEKLSLAWASNPEFAPTAKHPEPGYDPVIGIFPNHPCEPRGVTFATKSDDNVDAANDPKQPTASLPNFTTFTGGGYFFSPAIGHIRDLVRR
jgi:Dyp-type peroxidase family